MPYRMLSRREELQYLADRERRMAEQRRYASSQSARSTWARIVVNGRPLAEYGWLDERGRVMVPLLAVADRLGIWVTITRDHLIAESGERGEKQMVFTPANRDGADYVPADDLRALGVTVDWDIPTCTVNLSA